VFFLPHETTVAKRPDNILTLTAKTCIVVYRKEENLINRSETIKQVGEFFNVETEISLIPLEGLLRQYNSSRN
jgi:hypothetical protein